MTSLNELNPQSLTPMMRQYYELKDRCGGAILFFRMGDFYEIFGSDAEQVAPILELVLTSRERGDQQRIPFCGVPHHSARNYWLRLLRKGFKVALADQLEDPNEAKGLVKRDIVKVLTPGCIDDPEGLEQDSPNYLMAVHEEPEAGVWTIGVADLSTGELRLGQVPSLSAVKTRVEQFRPKELLARRFFHAELKNLLAGPLAESQILLEPLPEAPLRDEQFQSEIMRKVLGTSADLAEQPCGRVVGGSALFAAMMTHFQTLQVSLAPFLSVKPLSEPHSMILDETAIRDLELFETVRRRQTEGSLFREINHTLSPIGARLLRFNLGRPLLCPKTITERHTAVRELINLGEHSLAEIRSQLKNLPDLERLAARIYAQAASPMELSRVRHTLERAQWLSNQLRENAAETQRHSIFRQVAEGLDLYQRPLDKLQLALEETPRALGTGSGVIRSGCDPELDRLNSLARSGESQVEAYQEQLRSQTGIGSLKIKQHKSYGLLIEVTKTHASKTPTQFIRRQTMVNCDRYTTPELQELDQELSSAHERAIAREADIFTSLLQELGLYRKELQTITEALGAFDLIQSFAWQAIKEGYSQPIISSDERLELRGSRHPVVERYVGRHKFSPNDILLTADKRHVLITGPNMAGKSTVMRQAALSAILCQIGSFVPAQSAIMPVFDRIFTRVGAADDLSRGQSTFMVEMSEAAHILRHATGKSLVILDEVGRGTSTIDGLALASAILKDLAERVRCFSLFATHYHELVPFAALLPTVKPMRTEVLEQNGTILFTHILRDGAADSSYGLEVARIAGIPETVLIHAKAFMNRSDKSTEEAKIRPVIGASRYPKETASQEILKSSSEPSIPLERSGFLIDQDSTQPTVTATLLQRLKNLNLNRMTPLQALNFLSEIQDQLKIRSQRPLFEEEG